MAGLRERLTSPEGLRGLTSRRSRTSGAPQGGYQSQRTFEYVAASASGLRHKGKMQAASPGAVSAALQEDGWMPLSITETTRAGINTDLTEMFGQGQKSVKLSVPETAAFFRQTAELLISGVAMTFVLEALGQEASPKVRKICDGLSESLSAGVPLSEAMGLFPDAFDNVTRSYIASGEASGTLPQTMARLALSMEKRNELRLKIKGVTSYPKMVAGVIGLIVIGIIKFMVPMYEDIYASFDSELPAPTRALVSLSDNLLPIKVTVSFPTPYFLADNIDSGIFGLLGRVFFLVAFVVGTETLRNKAGKDAKLRNTIIKWGFLSAVTIFGGNYVLVGPSLIAWSLLAAIIVGIKYFAKSGDKNPRNARLVDRARFRLPLFGKMARLNATFQWATTMSGAISAGVPLGRALMLAGSTAGSRWYASLSEPLQNAVMGGRPLSEALADHSDLYPPSVRAMIATGEVTGNLGTMFDNIARTTQTEVDAQIAGLAAKVEVMLLVVMGIVVGGLLVALYLPIINLATAASGGG